MNARKRDGETPRIGRRRFIRITLLVLGLVGLAGALQLGTNLLMGPARQRLHVEMMQDAFRRGAMLAQQAQHCHLLPANTVVDLAPLWQEGRGWGITLFDCHRLGALLVPYLPRTTASMRGMPAPREER